MRTQARVHRAIRDMLQGAGYDSYGMGNVDAVLLTLDWADDEELHDAVDRAIDMAADHGKLASNPNGK